MKTAQSNASRVSLLLAALGLAVVLWLPRGTELDRYVTPDETIWLARSGNFYWSLSHHDFPGTYQYVHPGVTVMWLGAAGYLLSAPEFDGRTPEQVGQWRNKIAEVLLAEQYDPMEVLASARLIVLLANIAVLLVAFLVATRALGFGPALAGFLILALDPFHVAHSRLLHVDATGANLVLLALLLALAYATNANQTSVRWMMPLCGVVTGLALLTRSGSVILVPCAGLILLIRVAVDRLQSGRPFDLRELWSVLWPLTLWPISAAIVYVALWPAMWSDPLVMLERVYDGATRYAQEGHALPIFFRGVAHDGDPGRLFYAIAFLWRTTPTTLIGIVFALVFISVRIRRGDGDRSWQAVLGLVGFAVLFAAAMSTGAKKFDRYLLPAIGPLDLVAGWGWYSLIASIGGYAWLRGLLPRIGLGSVALGSQAVLLLITLPYSLSYYDPVMGGAGRAPEIMPVGWGEGLDQVAGYLNGLPYAEEIQVYTDAWLAPFAMEFKGGSHSARFAANAKGLTRWLRADYYVLYITQEQQGLIPQPLLDYFAQQPSVLDVTIDGITYARVFDLRALPLPEYFHSGGLISADWGGTVRLVSAGVAKEPVSAGKRVAVEFGVQPLVASEPGRLGVRVTLVDARGQEIAADDILLSDGESGQWVRSVRARFTVPEQTAPGRYEVVAIVQDDGLSESLPAIDPRTGQALPSPLFLGEIEIVAPDSEAAATPAI